MFSLAYNGLSRLVNDGSDLHGSVAYSGSFFTITGRLYFSSPTAERARNVIGAAFRRCRAALSRHLLLPIFLPAVRPAASCRYFEDNRGIRHGTAFLFLHC